MPNVQINFEDGPFDIYANIKVSDKHLANLEEIIKRIDTHLSPFPGQNISLHIFNQGKLKNSEIRLHTITELEEDTYGNN